METIFFTRTRPTDVVSTPISKKTIIAVLVICLTISFLLCGRLLQLVDFTAAVLDIGVLSVLLFGILALVLTIFCSLWLQEILWKPFKTYRNNLHIQFNQLTLWQQCILYFSVFFLLLYASLWALAIVF